MTAHGATAARRGLAGWALSALQVAATLALLSWALGRIDRSLFAREKLAFGWLAAALACTAPAFAAAALRWSFTARRLDVPLSFGRALSEVYLASFLNSVLPTGLVGDVLRAARHVDQASRRTHAVLSVALERLSGQLLLWLVLPISLASWPGIAGALPWLLPLALILAALWVALRSRALRTSTVTQATEANANRDWPEAPPALWPALRRALFADGALAVQLTSSALVLAACALGFACTAKGLSVPLSLADLARIVPPLLALSALPVSIGGFGLREAASAALYAQDGLDPATGIAVASTFGCLNVLGSAPGALFAWLRQGAKHVG
jgi:uncharacterized membrane protein YbhN (UPF0104 family)